MVLRSRVFSISIIFAVGAVAFAAGQERKPANSRSDTRQQLEQELKNVELRARGFVEHQRQLDKYARDLQSRVEAHQRMKETQKKGHEKARREYIRQQRARKVIAVESYRPAWEAEQAKQQREHRQHRREFVEKRRTIREAIERSKNRIPEDKEVGLDYDKM